MSKRFQDKVVIVSGAGSVGSGWGNGRAAAVLFAQEGARVYGVDRNRAAMAETAERIAEFGGSFTPVECDVTGLAAVRDMVADCHARFGRIDVLVNNVGGSAAGGPVEMSEEVWDTQVDFNLKSVFLTCKHVLPHMLAQGSGRIVAVGAGGGLKGGAQMGAYSASKSALMRLVESMSAELRDAGIHVNAVLPSTLDTPANRAAMPDADPARWVAPAALAEVIGFLASDAARAIHGAMVPVFGRV